MREQNTLTYYKQISTVQFFTTANTTHKNYFRDEESINLSVCLWLSRYDIYPADVFVYISRLLPLSNGQMGGAIMILRGGCFHCVHSDSVKINPTQLYSACFKGCIQNLKHTATPLESRVLLHYILVCFYYFLLPLKQLYYSICDHMLIGIGVRACVCFCCSSPGARARCGLLSAIVMLKTAALWITEWPTTGFKKKKKIMLWAVIHCCFLWISPFIGVFKNRVQMYTNQRAMRKMVFAPSSRYHFAWNQSVVYAAVTDKQTDQRAGSRATREGVSCFI